MVVVKVVYHGQVGGGGFPERVVQKVGGIWCMGGGCTIKRPLVRL